MTPGISTAYLNHFFEKGKTGIAHATPQLSLSLQRKNISLETSFGYQFGIDGRKKDTSITSMGVRVNF